MGDKVIDFQAAKERIKSAKVSDSDFSIEKEIAWVDEQLEVADMELEEITNEMEELTQYIIELTNYMAGISVALSIRDARYKMIDALLVVAAVAVTVGILLGLITLTVHLRVDTERQLRNTWRNEGP